MAAARESQFVLLDEFDRFFRIGQAGVAFIDRDVFFHAAQLPEFGLDADAFGVRPIHHAFCDRDIFFKWLVAGVDHDRTVKPRVDAIVAGGFVSMIEMDGENGFREHLSARADNGLEHALISVAARAFGKLNDKWRLALDVAAEKVRATVPCY